MNQEQNLDTKYATVWSPKEANLFNFKFFVEKENNYFILKFISDLTDEILQFDMTFETEKQALQHAKTMFSQLVYMTNLLQSKEE